MTVFPLIHNRLSNEKIQSILLIPLFILQLPFWISKPSEVFDFSVLLLCGLIIDSVFNFIRFKRINCGVSAAITTMVLTILTQGIPLWARITGLAAGLVFGKHIWGGTGKNALNPALTGIFVICLLFKLDINVFPVSGFTVAAMILALPFMFFRPYASVGLVVSMILSLVFQQQLSFENIIIYGVFFWSTLVITDPVTVTPRPLIGFVGGLLIGFVPLMLGQKMIVSVSAILVFNVLSFVIDKYVIRFNIKPWFKLKIKKLVEPGQAALFLLDEKVKPAVLQKLDLSPDRILDKIRKANVFGLGGAGFDTYEKLKSYLEAKDPKKYILINAVECDPGLVHDQWVLNNKTQEIILGIELLHQLVSPERTVIAVKKDVELNLPNNIELYKMPDYYPAGYEKALIRNILNIALPDVPPSVSGILVLNIQTIVALYEAVYLDRRLQSKFITIADMRNKKSWVAQVVIGHKIKETLEKIPLRGFPVFSGGGMMQSHLIDETDIIDHHTNFIAVAQYPLYKESVQCSKCRLCTITCPMGLRVKEIADLLKRKELEALKKYNPEKCIHCGYCSFICLAGNNLAIRVAEAAGSIKTISN